MWMGILIYLVGVQDFEPMGGVEDVEVQHGM